MIIHTSISNNSKTGFKSLTLEENLSLDKNIGAIIARSKITLHSINQELAKV